MVMKSAKYLSSLVLLAGLTVPLLSDHRAGAAEPSPAPSLEELRASVAVLEQEAAELEEQNQGMRMMLKEMEDNEIYLVVDTENNRLTIRRGDRVLRTVVVGTGSRQYVEEETGRNWYFETPIGTLTVLGKERNPVWIRPDWSYVEENMPVPPKDDPDRLVRGVLGKYALLLGNSYKLHGTTYTDLLGTHFTHGCVSMGDDDLEAVYKAAKVGTKVYIY
jgi:L,D-transpeptidase ErfK/SrfK